MPKKVIFILVGVFLVILGYSLISQIISTLRSDDRLEQASTELHKLELKNRELRKRLAEVKSIEFIEQQARDKLSFGREGETVVIIPEEKIQEVLSDKDENEEPKLPNWQGWLRLFF